MPGPSYEQRRQLLERHFLLGRLSPGEIDKLLVFARIERYPAGREIFAKGAPGTSLMAVLSGNVRISAPAPSGKEIVLNMIGAGDIFGEIAVLDGEARTADAIAMTDCHLLVINRRDLMPVLEAHADICMMLLQIVCRRLRRTSEQVEDLLFRDLQSRMAKALLQLGVASDGPEQSPPRVGLHLSQQELGNLVGGSRESVNRQLQLWHKAGLIQLDRRGILIRDRPALGRLL